MRPLQNQSLMSFSFIGFGVLSMFGMILLEIFSALYVYKITGSLTITYACVGLQMIAETLLTYALPGLLRRFGPAWLLVLSVPFRVAAFALLLMPAPNLFAIFAASLLISVSSTASEVPRGVLLAAVTVNRPRGFNLGIFEAFRYGSLAAAPLIGGYAFELGGFAAIAILSTVLSLMAAAFGAKVQAELGGVSDTDESADISDIRVPWGIRILWWSTGVRYLGENCLYPLLALILYAGTIKLGWIAAVAAIAGIAFGAMADRIRADILLILALSTLAIGWTMRSQPIAFELALVVGMICAVGGKAAGIIEKKLSYDFGERYKNNVHYVGRREREMLLARAIVLVPCLAFGLGPDTAVIAVAIFLVGNVGAGVASQFLQIRERRLRTNR